MPYVVGVREVGKNPWCDRLRIDETLKGGEGRTYIVGVRQGRKGVRSNRHCVYWLVKVGFVGVRKLSQDDVVVDGTCRCWTEMGRRAKGELSEMGKE